MDKIIEKVNFASSVVYIRVTVFSFRCLNLLEWFFSIDVNFSMISGRQSFSFFKKIDFSLQKNRFFSSKKLISIFNSASQKLQQQNCINQIEDTL